MPQIFDNDGANSSGQNSRAHAVALMQILFTVGVVWEVVAAQKAAKNMIRPQGPTTKIFGLTVSSSRVRALVGWVVSLGEMLFLARVMNKIMPNVYWENDTDGAKAYFQGLGLDKANKVNLFIWSILLLPLRELFDENNILRRVARPAWEKISTLHDKLPEKLKSITTSSKLEAFLRIYVPIMMVVNSQASIFYEKNGTKFSPLTDLLSDDVDFSKELSDVLLYVAYSLLATFAYHLAAGRCIVWMFDIIGGYADCCNTSLPVAVPVVGLQPVAVPPQAVGPQQVVGLQPVEDPQQAADPLPVAVPQPVAGPLLFSSGPAGGRATSSSNSASTNAAIAPARNSSLPRDSLPISTSPRAQMC